MIGGMQVASQMGLVVTSVSPEMCATEQRRLVPKSREKVRGATPDEQGARHLNLATNGFRRASSTTTS